MKRFTPNPIKPLGASFLFKVFAGIFLFFMILIGILKFIALVSEPKWPSLPVTQRKYEESPTIKELWRQKNLFIGEGEQSLLTTKDEKVFFIGSHDQFHSGEVIALDGLTGEEKWSKGYSGVALIPSSSALYVGGIGTVIALDITSGAILWKVGLPISRSVTLMFFLDNNLIVDTVSDRYHILSPLNGEILRTVPYNSETLPFWKAVEENRMAPVITDKIIFIRRGTFAGKVVALDRKDNTILWTSNFEVASNVALTEKHLYALTSDGQLLQINPLSGSGEVLVSFKPAPFILVDKGYKFNYYVAVDAKTSIVYVYLGDSGELLAFRIE